MPISPRPTANGTTSMLPLYAIAMTASPARSSTTEKVSR